MDFSGRVRSVEFVPKKRPGTADIEEAARILEGSVNMVTSPENPLGLPGIDPLLSLYILTQELNAVPVPHITPRDKNSLFITSQIISAVKFGINTFLVIGGDGISKKFNAREVRELDVLETITAIREGKNHFQTKSIPEDDSVVGAALNPYRPSEEDVVSAKIASGAEFFITQAIFDAHHLQKAWIQKRKFKLIAGFIPLKRRSQVQFADKLHIRISDKVRERLMTSEDPSAESFRIITELIDDLDGYADGIHIMPMGNYRMAKEILETF